MNIAFEHRQTAHCESGVTANLFTHAGLTISEAMVFGVGAGLLFAYLPFVRVNHLPLIGFRTMPGSIFQRATRSLGVKTRMVSFSTPEMGEQGLDKLLARGIPVGAQTSVFWLPYFPPSLRFHFNSHNLVVYGKDGADYLLSDPTLEIAVTCPAQDLSRSRFAKGPLSPKGKLYWIEWVPKALDLRAAILSGIGVTCRDMRAPFPLVGWRGIRFFAGRVEAWPKKLGAKSAAQHLGHAIRMQEEIGTGGGGFRFMYAAFLQEAGLFLECEEFSALSIRLTKIGERWREFAALSARICKGRSQGEMPYREAASLLHAIAIEEREFFEALRLAKNAFARGT